MGHTEDSDKLAELGEGPDLLYFNRSFSSTRSDIDEAQRISKGDESLSSEAFELAIDRVTEQIDIGQILIDIFYNQTSVGGFSLDPAFQISQDADIITVTNTPKGKTSDIQYLIHALFLSSIRDTAELSLLESTARLFTTSMFSHLPANKTLILKFFIPKSPSWSAIRSAQDEVLEILSQQTQGRGPRKSLPYRRSTQYPACDDQTPTANRITPQDPEKSIIIAQGKYCDLFRLFTVVLDRAKFISEAGVYFYMADLDASKDSNPFMEFAGCARRGHEYGCWAVGVVVLVG
ncbi:hypothetical protein PEX2_068500 [Penicillium expansum]|uniref:Uncharacterized protein n=1 Tax=Penicillium expansum TaxID=27334 RepID=A0A0A2K1M7_PENEN|nr:hypothetical protein PEX2_068500 [Penicillium expansum]KGO58340.1 hypothetical protein PEX2_068500 [Penicillium expansum]